MGGNNGRTGEGFSGTTISTHGQNHGVVEAREGGGMAGVRGRGEGLMQTTVPEQQ